MFFIAYAFKGQMQVFAGLVKIVSDSSHRTSVILKYFCTLSPEPKEGAQWLSGRVLDTRPKGRGFEPHWRHCVVVLEQDTFILA